MEIRIKNTIVKMQVIITMKLARQQVLKAMPALLAEICEVLLNTKD